MKKIKKYFLKQVAINKSWISCVSFKSALMLFIFFSLTAFSTLRAQSESKDVLPPNEDIYVLDGKNHSFAWGRHIAPDKIAIGLSDEGVFEIRNDNAIWLTAFPESEDRQIADIINDGETGNLIFAYHFPDMERELSRVVIGSYDPSSQKISDKDGKLLATITQDGNIVSPQRETYLYVNVKNSDKRLCAFFFISHYLPLKK
jgi:hypothetical protein